MTDPVRRVAVMVDGKHVQSFGVSAAATIAEAAAAISTQPPVRAALGGRPIARIVHGAGGHLINIVTATSAAPAAA